MLGVLKAGAAYLPLDPASPPARIRELIQDSGVSVIIPQPDLREQASRFGLQVIDERGCGTGYSGRPDGDAGGGGSGGDDAAYLLYTSGSTGKPKGVVVPHRGVVRLVVDADYVILDASTRIPWLSSICFDAVTFELWGALLNGGTCIVPRQPVGSLARLGSELSNARVNTAFMTTALYNVMIEECPQTLSTLRQLIVGGEALSPDHMRRGLDWLPDCTLLNAYGPTETTTFAATHVISEVGDGAASVPLGLPIPQTGIYVLDRHLEPVPSGVIGEIYIGGAGVALGYHNDAVRTRERFLPDPFSTQAGGTMFRTGDLGFFDARGRLEYAGRDDGQVKVRGFRIECGEVESALNQHPAVAELRRCAEEIQTGCGRTLGIPHPARGECRNRIAGVQGLVARAITPLHGANIPVDTGRSATDPVR